MVSRQLNWIEIQLGCLIIANNSSFYSNFGRNRPIVSIDHYDETVHREPFQKYRNRPIVMDGPDAAVEMRL